MSKLKPFKEGDGDWLFIVSGPTRYAPYLAGWQEFKDNIRKYVKEQPGWADVISGQRRGELQGWCRLKHREDAESVYNTYSRSKGVLVHVFETSHSTGDFQLLKCNCWAHFSDVSERGHSPKRSGINIGDINSLAGRGCAASTPQYMMQSPTMYSYNAYGQAPNYSAYSFRSGPMQMAAPQMPVYSTSTSGLPVNMGNGAMLTEARGIFISGLNYSVGPTELNALLNTVGRPVDSRLHRDSRTGLFKGVATAQFATKEEAAYAATQLNGKQHMGMTLKVRMDQETTVVGQVAPLVVNGSTTYRY